jgi:hypothetical protein
VDHRFRLDFTLSPNALAITASNARGVDDSDGPPGVSSTDGSISVENDGPDSSCATFTMLLHWFSFQNGKISRLDQ